MVAPYFRCYIMKSIKDEISLKIFLFTLISTVLFFVFILTLFAYIYSYEFRNYLENNVTTINTYIKYQEKIIDSLNADISSDYILHYLLLNNDNIAISDHLEQTYRMSKDHICFRVYDYDSEFNTLITTNCNNNILKNSDLFFYEDGDVFGRIQLYYDIDNNGIDKLKLKLVKKTDTMKDKYFQYQDVSLYHGFRNEIYIMVNANIENYDLYYVENFTPLKHDINIMITTLLLSFAFIFTVLYIINKLVFSSLNNKLNIFRENVLSINSDNPNQLEYVDSFELDDIISILNRLINNVNMMIYKLKMKEHDIRVILNMIPIPVYCDSIKTHDVKYFNKFFKDLVQLYGISYYDYKLHDLEIPEKSISFNKYEENLEDKNYLIYESSYKDLRLCLVTDISELNLLKYQNQFISSILNTIPIPIILFDTTNKVIFQNNVFDSLLAFKNNNKILEIVNKFEHSVSSVNIETIIFNNNSYKYMIMQSLLKVGLNNIGYIYSILDITDITNLSNKLNKIQENFMMTIENNDILLFTFNFDGIVRLSENSKNVLNIAKSMTFSDFISNIHEDDVENFQYCIYNNQITNDIGTVKIKFRYLINNNYNWFIMKGRSLFIDDHFSILCTISNINEHVVHQQHIEHMNEILEEKVKEKTNELNRLNVILLDLSRRSMEASSQLTTHMEMMLTENLNE